MGVVDLSMGSEFYTGQRRHSDPFVNAWLSSTEKLSLHISSFPALQPCAKQGSGHSLMDPLEGRIS